MYKSKAEREEIEEKRFKYREYCRNYERTVRGRYERGQDNASNKGIKFSLTFEEYKELLCQSCFYCNGFLNPTGVGLDRINNDIGYITGNVRPCCLQCNRAKSNLSESEFVKWLLAIAGNYLKIM